MNKLLKTIFTTLIMVSISVTPTFAYYSADAATVPEAMIKINKEYSNNHWFTTLYGGINVYHDTYDTYTRAYILDNDLNTVLSKEEYCVNWAKELLPSIIPNGTSREEAIKLIADYVTGYLYFPSYYGLEELNLMQNADYGIKTKRGVCSTYSTMFRGLLSYIPFDNDWKVDYANVNPQWLKVRLMTNENHIWNSITIDNKVYYYDLANNRIGEKTENTFLDYMYTLTDKNSCFTTD